jgi:hypothetical protein
MNNDILKNITVQELCEESWFIRNIIKINIFVGNGKYVINSIDFTIFIIIIWSLALIGLIDEYIKKCKIGTKF